jgi:DNA-binding transcriptional regulator YiaG
VKTKRRKKKRKAKTELPAQLRAWRKRRKLSQSGAAIRLRMSKRTLQEWEQGRAIPRGLALTALRDKVPF